MGSFSKIDSVGLKELAEAGIKKKQKDHEFVYRYPPSSVLPFINEVELVEDLRNLNLNKRKLAFYVHIPFCKSICSFCHYFKIAKKDSKTIENYINALKKEMSAYSHLLGNNLNADSIFLGGGTPTSLKAEQLAELLNVLKESFGIRKEVETTFESSPETLDKDKLVKLREAGFNRISIGIQSFDERVAGNCSRESSPEKSSKAIEDSRNAGFNNLNIDLMYGLPGQSLDSWKKTLEVTESFSPESITASDLRIMPNTAFYSVPASKFPEQLEVLSMYYEFVDKFLDLGYIQQFPYQFTKKGKEIKFLENQWSNGEFLGIGASSCSFLSNWDYNNYFPLHDYLVRIGSTGTAPSIGKRLSKRELMIREIVLGLKKSGINRRQRGINKNNFKRRFSISVKEAFGEKIKKMQQLGLLEDSKGFLYLSHEALPFHDEIARKFYE